ncbi:MAG: IS1182 family transposase [PVC group bacterium]|nr:IS1182 family transposase [PVC group bacterium]
MSYEINAKYEQGRLLPQYLDDRIPEDHPSRFIFDFVSFLNLEELGFRSSSNNSTGHPFYGSGLLLSAWLYGYFLNIRSTRGLERVCRFDLGGIWLTDWHAPDHNTLWRFIAKHNELVSELFIKVTQVASDLGLVDLALNALDGTRIRSEVSTRGRCKAEQLHLMLKNLDAGIIEVMEAIKSQHETEEEELKLTNELKSQEIRKAKIENSLEELKKSGRKRINPNDVDARLMKFDKTKESGYNAQADVDEKSGIIVAETVVNDENDKKMLTSMVEKIEENLGKKPLETVADCGYYSPDELMKAEAKGIDVLVNIPKPMVPECNPEKYHKSKFQYDKEKDVFICPEGKELKYSGKKKDRHNKKMIMKVYRCKKFKNCKKRYECSQAEHGRSLEKGPHYEAVMRQLEKQKEEVAKEKLKRRKSIVERVFAQIKWNMGFSRFTYRGLPKVRAQWSLICSVYNLKIIYKKWKDNKLILAQI